MTQIFKLIALVLGIGQSTPQPRYQDNYKEGTFLFGKEVTFVPGVGYKENADPRYFTKKEFFGYMATKNVICL
jgi:hypothetical protein